MKICPVCQTAYTGDSDVFCLNDGAALVDRRNFRQTPARQTSGAALVLAILGGFLLFGLIVGGVGLYLFGRENGEKAGTSVENLANSRETPLSGNANLPSVQIESNKAANIRTQTSPTTGASPQIIASASSVRRQDKGNFYFPNLAFDSNPATAWCEGASGAGVGEWLKFEFDRAVTLRQIKIQPGYFKSRQSWRENNRVAGALIEFSDGTSKRAAFADSMETQTVDVGRAKTNWVKITLEDYFAGANDSEDTLISEVSFVTEP